MATPITIPAMGDDMFDVSTPDSPLNQLFRWWNEVQIASGYGTLSRSPQKYYVNADGNSVFVGVQDIEDAVIVQGADVTSVGFWNRLLLDIITFANRFVLRSVVDEGLDGTPWADGQIQFPSYGVYPLILADAGMVGIERRNGESIDDAPIIEPGSYQYLSGDIIGPWMFRDIANLLQQLRYKQILFYTESLWKRALRLGNTQSRGKPWDEYYSIVFNEWAGGVSYFEGRAFSKDLYGVESSVGGPSDVFGVYFSGQAETQSAVPYVRQANLYGFTGSVDLYGVARLARTGVGFSPVAPYPSATIDSVVKAGSVEARNEDGYLDLFDDLSGATFPWTLHGVDQGIPNQDPISRGFKVDTAIGLFVPDYTYEYVPD